MFAKTINECNFRLMTVLQKNGFQEKLVSKLEKIAEKMTYSDFY